MFATMQNSGRKYGFYTIDLIGVFKQPTNTGFAIGSPGTRSAWSRYMLRILDDRATSDQIKASWIMAHNVYLNHYIWRVMKLGLKPVAIIRKGYS